MTIFVMLSVCLHHVVPHSFTGFPLSNTGRHLAEFQMIEPELAFSDLKAVMDNAEAFVKHVIAHTLQASSEQ
jgi:hypothetical protein